MAMKSIGSGEKRKYHGGRKKTSDATFL